MKAVVIDGYGGSDRLQVREVAAPEPKAGEVLVRVRAAGVNPIDWKIRRGMLRPVLRLRFPFVLGCDAAGEVERVGPGVTRFRPGDAVTAFLSPGSGGGYAQYAVVKEIHAALKPSSLSFPEAAALPVAGLTALQALRDLGRLRPGGSALVHGAAGGVGHLAVQVARALGARVAGTCGPGNVEFVRGLGADPVLDSTGDDFTRRGETYDVVFDAVAKSTFGACRRALRPRGTYVTTLPSLGVFFWGAVLPAARLLGDGPRAKFLLVRPSGPDLELLGRFADAGKVRPSLTRTLPLDRAREAHEASEAGHTRGKIVLEVA